MADIQPGSKINIKVVKTPTSERATKTIVRLLSKDAAVQKENRRHEAIRKQGYSPSRRGGRLYGGQLVKQHPVKGKPGEAGTITATLDVLTDLRGVERFLEITPA